MNEQQARVIADASDWYFRLYMPMMETEPVVITEVEMHLGESLRKLFAAEKILPPGIKVLRDTPTGPVLNEPYVIQPTDTGWRPDAPEA